MADQQKARDRRLTLRVFLGAVVVTLGLAALIWALEISLDHYSAGVKAAGGAGAVAANDGSSAVVAVMAPMAAAILGLVGLYFGVSSTGSARGREADAKVNEAKATTAKAEAAREQAAADRVQSLHSAGVTPEEIAKIAGAAPPSPPG